MALQRILERMVGICFHLVALSVGNHTFYNTSVERGEITTTEVRPKRGCKVEVQLQSATNLSREDPNDGSWRDFFEDPS